MKLVVFLLAAFFPSLALAQTPDRTGQFPIAVWLQSPQNAARYKAIGINRFVGLWDGPKADQLDALEKAGMPVICQQNAEALNPRWNREIVGWMQGDEPDNAQPLSAGHGYGNPVTPEEAVRNYEEIRKADPTRPVMLNLGQGVAWDGWTGRGSRTNHPEDYPKYVKAGDIISFDIYPMTHTSPQVAGKPWFVGRGVQRLIEWTGGSKPVWACIETTHINNAKIKPTPSQVRTEVWMALIHGASGIIYFAHQFQPSFIEAGLLADPEMTAGIGKINQQIQEVGDALQSAPIREGFTIQTTPKATDEPLVAATVRKVGQRVYVFAVAMRPGNIRASFNVPQITGEKELQVLGEDRTVHCAGGSWEDSFADFQVHLYEMK